MSVFVALVVMLFQIRANAYKLTRLLRRPYPYLSKGIGSWNQVIDALTWVGLVFYVGTPIMNSESDWSDEARILTFFVSEHVILAAKVLLMMMIPLEPARAKLLAQRRQYVRDKLLIGQDDPEGLSAECKKPPIDVSSATQLTADSAEWKDVDHRVFNMNLWGGPAAFFIPENELAGDRDDFV